MRTGAGGELGFKGHAALAVIESGGALPGLYLHQHLRQIAVAGGAGDERNVGRALEYLFALLLGDTANDGEFLSLFLKFFEIVEAVEDLLLGLVADGTGVVEDEVGLLDGVDPAISLGDERTDDLLGVVYIHLASEGFDKESFRCRTHYVCPSGKVLTSSITDPGLRRDWQSTMGIRQTGDKAIYRQRVRETSRL